MKPTQNAINRDSYSHTEQLFIVHFYLNNYMQTIIYIFKRVLKKYFCLCFFTTAIKK